MSSETGQEDTNWGRRVRSSAWKHKYLIKAKLTGKQRAQKAVPTRMCLTKGTLALDNTKPVSVGTDRNICNA